jgi:primosomal protein N' (replication factor Y)
MHPPEAGSSRGSSAHGDDETAAIKLGPQQKVLLEKIRGLPTKAEITFAQLHAWKISPSIAHSLVKKNILKLVEKTAYRGAYDDDISDAEIVAAEPPPLMAEQAAAVEVFSKLLREKSPQPQLLHGVTGSGKTEVYLRLISLALEMGGTALMLVPEVALTPQMIGRLRGRFGNNPEHCVVWHSHLSEGERIDAYRAIVTGKCKIVVGARSALFAPLKKLKLIILDEEHEMAYKQMEAPRYHARDVALKRAQLTGALCIFGSATPSLETIEKVRLGAMGLQLLSKRIDDRPMPLVHVVDLRHGFGKTPWFSTLLKEKISDRLEKGEQALLFLNRRGHSTSFLCQKCGFIAQCHQCSIATTYHADIGKLRCHMCGYEAAAPLRCPTCGSDSVRWRGVGTQKVEQMLNLLYPRARVARVDSDALDKKNNLREIFSNFRRGQLDILVGTQMIAKGLDFPNVTLVGLIDADLSLHQPDFRAAERTFQLLVQVAGRSGRGDRSGEVVVQTFLPHSSTLQFARHVNYDGFIEEELSHRKEYGYPPYRHLICHLFRSRSIEKLNFYCEAWAREVSKNISGIEVRGPAPAPIERVEGLYRYQLWYLCDDVETVIPKIMEVRGKFSFDADITDSIDVDATQLM